jgi:hypothetical protein
MHTLLIITPQCNSLHVQCNSLHAQCNSLHIIIGIVKLYIRCTIVTDLSAAPRHTAERRRMSTDNVSGLLTDGHAAKRRRMSTDHTAKRHRMSTDPTDGHTAKHRRMSTDSVSGLLTDGHTAKCRRMSTDSVLGGLLIDFSAALGSATSGEQCSGSWVCFQYAYTMHITDY